MKRGQAGLEFLSNYGWTFLMILIIIGGLIVFGIHKPRDLLPDRCVFPAGFTCEENGLYLLADGNVNATIILSNQFGESLTINDVSMYYEDTPLTTCWHDTFVPAGKIARLSCISTTNNVSFAGERAKISVNILLTPFGKSLNQEVSGKVFSTVQ